MHFCVAADEPCHEADDGSSRDQIVVHVSVSAARCGVSDAQPSPMHVLLMIQYCTYSILDRYRHSNLVPRGAAATTRAHASDKGACPGRFLDWVSWGRGHGRSLSSSRVETIGEGEKKMCMEITTYNSSSQLVWLALSSVRGERRHALPVGAAIMVRISVMRFFFLSWIGASGASRYRGLMRRGAMRCDAMRCKRRLT